MEEIEDLDDMDMEQRSTFPVGKAQARALKIGDTVTVTVKGEVCGVSKGYGKESIFNLDVKFKGIPKVEANKADASVREMIGPDKAPVGRHKNEADKSLDDFRLGKKRAY
jgi:hypothetical protein